MIHKQIGATPLPSRGGARGGVCNFPFFIALTAMLLALGACTDENTFPGGNTYVPVQESRYLTTGTEVGHNWVDLGLSVCWATTNIGASNEGDYGNYYAWGETTTKSNYSWSTYKYCQGSDYTMTKYCTSSISGTVDNKTQLDLADDAARQNWGGKWRMPTIEELNELNTKCAWTWTTRNGHKGYLVTGPSGKSIFLPVAGCRNDTSLDSDGWCGYYWSSSLNAAGPGNARYLDFYDSGHSVSSYYRYYGQSVRPVTEP